MVKAVLLKKNFLPLFLEGSKVERSKKKGLKVSFAKLCA